MQGLMAFYVIVQVIKSHNESLAKIHRAKPLVLRKTFPLQPFDRSLYIALHCLTGAACLI
jgi:hypothetical protein